MALSSLIHTPRLELLPATAEILSADRTDRRILERLIGAAVPPAWPPPLLDRETLDEFIRIKSGGSDPWFSCWYWICRDTGTEHRVLIGSGGIAARESVPGEVVLGYSVLPRYQNRGYATEAVQHLIPAIFSVPGIRRINASTYPELAGSIRVLEKNGFVFSGKTSGGSGSEEGTLRYVLVRPDP
jgi:RimJ/RimL family protein N-acetyltransferase